MLKSLVKPLSTMSFGDAWSPSREEAFDPAQGNIAAIVQRAVMGARFMDYASGVTLRVVGISWAANSSTGYLTLESKSGHRTKRRCQYDSLTHNIKMFPA